MTNRKSLIHAVMMLLIAVLLTGCISAKDAVGVLDKASYDDIYPTAKNLLDLSVANKNYKLSELGLSTEELEAIEHYKKNTIRMVDLPYEVTGDYLTEDGVDYSISNHAYDIKLVEKVFGVKVETVELSGSPDVLSALGGVGVDSADIISEFIYSASRVRYVDFAETGSVDRVKYYYSDSSDGEAAFIDLLALDESERVIGLPSSYQEISPEFITSYGLQIRYYSTTAEAAAAIASGEIKGYISGELSIELYSQYSMGNISRYNIQKMYSVAYRKGNDLVANLGTAIHKLLDYDDRSEYNKYKSLLNIVNGTYLTDAEEAAIAYYEDSPLKVEMPVGSFPDSYIDSNGNWAGAMVDSFEYKAKMLGLNYEIVTPIDSTFGEIMDRLGGGDEPATSDAGVGIYYTEPRTEYLDYSQTLLELNFVLVSKSENPTLMTLDEVSKQDIGIVTDFGYIDIVLDVAFSKDKEYTEYPTEAELIKGFEKGEIEYFIMAERNLSIFKSRYMLYDADVKYKFSYETNISFVFAKSTYSSDLVTAFNKMEQIENISKYSEYYDISKSIQEIVDLENQLATRNVIFGAIALLLVLSVTATIVIYRQREETKKDARTDKLTGVGNRRAFFEDFSKTNLAKYKILFIDLTKFKDANDTYGHDFGDLVLQVVAERLNDIDSKAWCYRLGGDEFVVTLPANSHLNIAKALKKVARPMQKATIDESKVDLKTVESDHDNVYDYRITFACGVIDISKFSEFDDLDDVLKYADLAMYKAKMRNRSGISITEVNRGFLNEFNETNQLEKEITNYNPSDIFCTVHQPVMDVSVNKVMGYETLVRYKKDCKMPPTKFLPIAISKGRVKELDLFVLEESIKLLDELISTNVVGSDFNIATNFATVTIAEIKLKEIDAIYSKYNVAKENIYIEISENDILSDRTLKKIKLLKKNGYNVSIDNFMAGNASLAFLSKLEVGAITIDKELLEAIHDERNDHEREEVIYSSIVDLSKKLGYMIIAEGVETKAELDYIKSLDVDLVQGFYFSKPLNREKLIKYLSKKK